MMSTEQTVDEIFDDANGDLAVGELENAVEKYQRCVQMDPDFFDGWHALGMALMKLGRFPEAIEAGKKAVEHQRSRSSGRESEDSFLGRKDCKRVTGGEKFEACTERSRREPDELRTESSCPLTCTVHRRLRIY